MKETSQFNNLRFENSKASFFDELRENTEERQAAETVALSHTKTEQLVYEQMFAFTRKTLTAVGEFSTRHLMVHTGIYNYSSLRRALIGLVNKMSIEKQNPIGSAKSAAPVYVVYSPGEILVRRLKAGFNPFPKEAENGDAGNQSARAIERLVRQHNLSRREAQVALKCADGLSNAEIAAKLSIRQETVKFHLRNIFIKFGVKRRTELMAHLFQHDLTDLNNKK